MENLRTNQRIHQARVALYPLTGEGAATWSFTTVRYTQGGRVPEILTEQSGRILCPPGGSSWAYVEVLYEVLREIRRERR